MKRVVYDLLDQMNIQDITTRIAFQCAPVISGIKVSNLLTILSEDDHKVADILAGTGLACRKLAEDHGRSVFILYRKRKLSLWILRRSNQSLLARAGFGGCGLERLLDAMSQRYQAYITEGDSYPHEIGVLLGYPPEDVNGFVVNKGKNCLLSGYWKVYGNPEAALRDFEAFDLARERILSQIYEGISLKQILYGIKDELDDVHAA